MNLFKPGFSESIFFIDSKKRVWIGDYSGIKMLQIPLRKNEPLLYIPVPAAFNIPVLRDHKVSDIFEDSFGTFIAAGAGLVKVYSDGSNQIIKTSDGLVSEVVSDIFPDKENNLWLGTALGLSRLVTRSGIRIYNQQDGLPGKAVYFAHPVEKDMLLIYNAQGLQLFNNHTRKLFPVLNTDKYVLKFMSSDKKKNILHPWRYSQAFDSNTMKINTANKVFLGDRNFYDGITDSNNRFFGDLEGYPIFSRRNGYGSQNVG